MEMKYLNIMTYKTQLKDGLDCYPETDKRVAYWFKTPMGYDVKENLGDFPIVIELSPINKNGTVNTHKRTILDNIVKDENNKFYTFYMIETDRDGLYQPDTVKIDGIIKLRLSTQYQRDRKEEYDMLNQNELRYDDEQNSTNNLHLAIEAIKAKYPKPE
jgi:hypothetical protein